MKQLLGCLDLKTNTLADDSREVYQYSTSTLDLWVMGNAVCGGKANNGEAIAALLEADVGAITEKLSGLYILVAFQKSTGHLWVFHDRTTSPVAFYYTVWQDKLFYGTSLKSVLQKSGCPRTFNESAVENFIVNGYLYGKETLVSNVEKLHAFHALSVKGGVVEQLPVSYSLDELSPGEALDAFAPTLDAAVRRSFEGDAEITLPLSSGYDSSYILHVAHEGSELPVSAFSIGGKFGKNELPAVRENAALYPRVKLETALTDNNTLKNFADIVWRLEGAVYEVGLFLQYELARLVSSHGKKHLICGECADQVLNDYYFNPDRVSPEGKEGSPMYYEFSEYPYIFGSYLILKKNGILANSFGIETKYPYLDKDFMSVAHALVGLNHKDKRVHVANCNKRLPEAVLRNISKIGGATDCHSLFESADAVKAFFEKIEQSDFYLSHREIIARHSLGEKEKQTGVARLKTAVRGLVLNALHIGTEGRRKDVYFHEEIKLREYLSYAYLILFQKLFLTDRFAAYSKEEPPAFDIDELI